MNFVLPEDALILLSHLPEKRKNFFLNIFDQHYYCLIVIIATLNGNSRIY